MPVYEYACQSCGHQFERRQSFSDAPVRECPECGQAVRKLLSPAGIVFKGSGWYITDSRKAESGAASDSSTKPDTAAKGDGAAKSDAPAKAEAPAKSESAPKADSGAKSAAPAPTAAAD